MVESGIGGGSSSTYRHRYRALPDSDMNDNAENDMGTKGVRTPGTEDEVYQVSVPRSKWWTRNRLVLPPVYRSSNYDRI